MVSRAVTVQLDGPHGTARRIHAEGPEGVADMGFLDRGVKAIADFEAMAEWRTRVEFRARASDLDRMSNEWTLEEQADYERFVANIGEPNTPEVEEWLSGGLELDESEFSTASVH